MALLGRAGRAQNRYDLGEAAGNGERKWCAAAVLRLERVAGAGRGEKSRKAGKLAAAHGTSPSGEDAAWPIVPLRGR